jgi:ATP-binding cassette subfamily B protein
VLIRHNQLILLDGATLALDGITGQEVHEPVRHLIAGRATLIAVHCLSDICEEPRIVVIDHGRILQSGAHQALAGMHGALSMRPFKK